MEQLQIQFFFLLLYGTKRLHLEKENNDWY